MTTIRFEIEAPILPWQRARRRGKQYFTSPEMAAYQNMVGLLCKKAMIEAGQYKPIEGPVAIETVFYSDKAVVTITTLEDVDYKTTRPDIDNLYKNIADAVNKIAYGDDSQVAKALLIKTSAKCPKSRPKTGSFKST